MIGDVARFIAGVLVSPTTADTLESTEDECDLETNGNKRKTKNSQQNFG